MTIKDFPQSNRTYRGSNDSDILPLPVRAEGNLIYSCWEVSPEELELITKYREVWLQIMMPIQPPVCLIAGNPFEGMAIGNENARQLRVEAAFSDIHGQTYQHVAIGNLEKLMVTYDEFEYLMRALPYMKGQHIDRIKKVSASLDTIIMIYEGGRILVIMR